MATKHDKRQSKPLIPIVDKRAIELAWLRRDYAKYCEYVHRGAWKPAKHHLLIAKHLEMIADGKIKRLIIELPPRHGKSMMVTETFPSFFLGKNPDKRVIEVSYGEPLATMFGRANRDKMFEFGGEIFGLTMSGSDASKASWGIAGHRGGMVSVGVGGSITGKGADLLIIDDPIKNRTEAESEAARKYLMREWESTIYTRLHAGGAIIVILTRWNESDFVAKLLKPDNGEPEDWVRLNLPCICDSEDDLLGRKIGEALWPEQGFDEAWAERTKLTLGAYAWSSLYQQKPTPAGGAIFKREWMNKTYTKLPEGATMIQTWDLPFVKSEASAKCAGIVMARHGPNIYYVDVINERMDFVENIAAMRRLSAKYPQARAKVVEDKANGPAIMSILKNELPGIVPFTPYGSKEERARAVTSYFEAGNVYFPEGKPWVSELVEDLCGFPNGEFKDQVDASTQGIMYLETVLGKVGGYIYRDFASVPEDFIISADEAKKRLGAGFSINIGIGLGGSRLGTAFVATAMLNNYSGVIALKSRSYVGVEAQHDIAKSFAEFVNDVKAKYGAIDYVYSDIGEMLQYKDIRSTADAIIPGATIRQNGTTPENDRIRITASLFKNKKLLLTDDCVSLVNAFGGAVWDMKHAEDRRISDGTYDIKALEAFEYTIERDARYLLYAMKED